MVVGPPLEAPGACGACGPCGAYGAHVGSEPCWACWNTIRVGVVYYKTVENNILFIQIRL